MATGFRLCITYAIRGRLAYLSHLETVEAMRRIVRRAQLPYAVSEGFNPHMKATFGPALPVGASGDDERFDVRLKEYVEPSAALARLQQAAPANLAPLSCAYTDLRDPALDVALPVSVWQARFAGDEQALPLLESSFGALLEKGYLEVVKKKRGKVNVKRVEFAEKLLVPPRFSVADGHVLMDFTTKQGADGALRPDLFIDTALGGVEEIPPLVSLVRRRLLGDDEEL